MAVISSDIMMWCSNCNSEWTQGGEIGCLCGPNDCWSWIIYNTAEDKLEFVSKAYLFSLSTVVIDALPSWMTAAYV